MTSFLTSGLGRIPWKHYVALNHGDPAFERELGFVNYNRSRIGYYGFLATGVFFFLLRAYFYISGQTVNALVPLMSINACVSVLSVIICLLFRAYRPEKPEDISRIHKVLVYTGALGFSLILSVTAGYEYLITGALSRLHILVICLSIILILPLYVLLLFFLLSVLTMVLTVYVNHGDIFILGLEHMHIIAFMITLVFISRIVYKTAARAYDAREALKKTNRMMIDENKGRLKALNTLKKSEGYLRTLFDKAPDAYLLYDTDQGQFIEINSYAETLFLYKNAEVAGLNYRDLEILNEEHCVLIDSIIDMTLDKSYTGPHEIGVTLRNGQPIVVEVRSALTTRAGRTVVLATARDITWRIQAEEQLRQSNMDLENRVMERSRSLEEANIRLKQEISDHRKTDEALRESDEMTRALINASRDSVMMLKPDGMILMANNMLAKHFKTQVQDLKGQSIFDLLQQELDATRLGTMASYLQQKGPSTFEECFFGRDYLVNVYPIVDEGPGLDSVAIFARDISDIKQAEKHIHSLSQELIRVQERERQRIALDLHDNVAQELASLKIICETLFDDHHVVPQVVKKRLFSASTILQHSIMSVRDMAYDLRPPGLDELGLVSTISNYSDEYAERNSIEVDFFSAGVSSLSLSSDAEINLYRITQEALHNAAKHASAQKITLRLTASFPTIILRIDDNGIGFDMNRPKRGAQAHKKMGIQGMEERVRLLSGTISMRSEPGKGTRIVVEIPIDENTITEETP